LIARRVLLFSAIALLAACASLPKPQAQRAYEGRFAVTAVHGGESDHSNGRFALAVRADGVTLDLASPFGNTLARIETTAAAAVLTSIGVAGERQRFEGVNAGELTQRVLGWPLPVAGLGDWIAGRPDPARPAAKLPSGADGFTQDGWTIRVLERLSATGAPRRLSLTRPPSADSTGPAIDLRLVLDDPQ
jgi:outer membrane lipoprotein LolB